MPGARRSTNASPTPRVITGMGFTLSTAYELDFWGRLRRGIESAQQNLLASEYGRDVVDWSLVAGTTQAYFTLRALDALIKVTRDSLVSFDASVDLTRRRAQGGVASDLDVRGAEVQRQTARVALADLVRQRSVALHQLQNLTARLDLAIPEGDLGVAAGSGAAAAGPVVDAARAAPRRAPGGGAARRAERAHRRGARGDVPHDQPDRRLRRAERVARHVCSRPPDASGRSASAWRCRCSTRAAGAR